MNARPRPWISVAALAAGLLGCRTPTEAFVEITTDGACHDVAETGITAGRIGAIETEDYGATTQACEEDGTIGSIVLYPEAEKNGEFAFKVVTSLGASLDACVAPDYGASCIVARRAMRFVPQEAFHVPVRMSLACAGVLCPDEQTCVDGTCRAATVDPADCEKSSGCDPTADMPPVFQKSAGGPGPEMARHVAVGADGTIAVTGNFQGKLDLGKGALTSAGDFDIVLASYAQSGALRWAKAFGAAGDDEGSSVAIDAAGSIYLLGTFVDSIELGGGKLVSHGAADVVLAKFSSFGKLDWSLNFGGAGGENGAKVAVSADGNVYVAGSFRGTMKVGEQTIEAAGGEDAFVASFTPAGKLRWAKALGGAADDVANTVGVGAGGEVYVAGQFFDHADFGQGTPFTSAGQGDVFVVSLDASGDFRWAKAFGSKGHDVALDLAVSADRVVVTGALAGVATIDGMPLAAVSGDGFIASLETDGTVAWGQAFGDPTGIDQGRSVAFADDGSIVLGGVIAQGSAFGSNTIAGTGVRNPFLAVLSADGEPRWAKAYAATPAPPSYADLTGVAPAAHGFVLAAGWFTGTLDVGGKTLKSAGAEDMFLLRVAPP